MLEWIGTHSSSLNVLANMGILAVWVLYAQILVNGVARDRRPHVLISRSSGQDLDADVLVCNMSREAIFVQLLLAHVIEGEAHHSRAISDLNHVRQRQQADEPGETRRTTSQGPLASGSYMRLGTFRDIFRWTTAQSKEPEAGQVLDLRVVFQYGPESKPLAAYRRFHVMANESSSVARVQPHSLDTGTMRSWRSRRTIRRWLHEHL